MLVRNLQVGKSRIELYSNVEKEKNNEILSNLYKTIYKIVDKQEKEGINVEDWFYSAKELDEIKKNTCE